jgi:uncharacterized membrane protein
MGRVAIEVMWWIAFVVLAVVVIVAVVASPRGAFGSKRGRHDLVSPREALDHRLALGEIDAEEYTRRRGELRGSGGAGDPVPTAWR